MVNPRCGLTSYCVNKKIQFRQGGTWILYQKYADKGYTGSKTLIYHSEDGKEHNKVHTFWTSKGRLFIYDLLKSMGILPVAERNDDN